MPKTYRRWDAEGTGKARLSHSVLMSVRGRLLLRMGPKFQEEALPDRFRTGPFYPWRPTGTETCLRLGWGETRRGGGRARWRRGLHPAKALA